MAVSPPTKAVSLAIGAAAPFASFSPATPNPPSDPPTRASSVNSSSAALSIASSAALAPSRPSPWHDIASSLGTGPSPPPAALTSAALRAWDLQLAGSDAVRHTLRGSPRLKAERDRAGPVEYKLKLIEPSQERFERLVTQMMWRLKQGRNEAIYELGLGDDGAVIGLSRGEMDASLSTLERMAAELGATVLVLREIVIDTDGNSEASRSVTSRSEASAVSGSGASGRSASFARRPDLDDLGRPRRGTKVLHDTEVPPFSLDEDQLPQPRGEVAKATDTKAEARVSEAKAVARRRKAAQRREARRLDLLRGDGTSSGPASSPDSRPETRPGSRLSALRPEGHGDGDGTPDDAFVDGLSIPLDTLSLSFADAGDPGPDTERICVEALVVRKSALDEEYYGEEDGWGFGDD